MRVWTETVTWRGAELAAHRSVLCVQRLVEGPSLADRLQEEISQSDLARLATQLLGALQAMQTTPGGPIAHGAITPRTIIMPRSRMGGLGRPHLTAFASAEQLPGPNDPNSAPALTKGILSHALAIDMEYAAPEALKGEARAGVSDAYSVGAVLAAVATGEPPKFGMSGLWLVPPELKDPRVANVVQGLLHKDWRRRLFAAQAAGVLRGQPMPALPTMRISPLLA